MSDPIWSCVTQQRSDIRKDKTQTQRHITMRSPCSIHTLNNPRQGSHSHDPYPRCHTKHRIEQNNPYGQKKLNHSREGDSQTGMMHTKVELERKLYHIAQHHRSRKDHPKGKTIHDIWIARVSWYQICQDQCSEKDHYHQKNPCRQHIVPCRKAFFVQRSLRVTTKTSQSNNIETKFRQSRPQNEVFNNCVVVAIDSRIKIWR